jgi:hypothetical protein
VLNTLYQTRVGRGRSTSSSSISSSTTHTKIQLLSKKDIEPIIQQSATTFSLSVVQQNHLRDVLRSMIKAGPHYNRMIDSSTVVQSFQQNNIFPKLSSSSSSSSSSQHVINNLSWQQQQHQQQRYEAAQLLATDAQQRGRFKRMSCILVSSSSAASSQQQHNQEEVAVTLVNGGWIVQDQCVRAQTEARKFVNRMETQIPTGKAGYKKQQQQQQSQQTSMIPNAAYTVSIADERILRRLECFAMGESTNNQSNLNDQCHEKQVHRDVRQVLQQLSLPLSPQGAMDALIKCGRWSPLGNDSIANKLRIEPWSSEIMKAATWYTHWNQQQTHEMAISPSGQARIDLSKYPCIAIDDHHTTFRDDAIGLRLRASTGRKFNDAISKWEVLIHIVDLSDIYSPQPFGINDPNNYLDILRHGAKSRGSSRYDLPFGPLHLFPPIVLSSLTLGAKSKGGINRCVTLWVYVDERSGMLMDAGLERSVISAPITVSYEDATAILDHAVQRQSNEDERKTRAVLLTIERILSCWNAGFRNDNMTAQQREDRLQKRTQSTNRINNDGKDFSFSRSRGHRLVDTALEMYTHVCLDVTSRRKVPLPHVTGAADGRVATAPLRRYIDGEAQRQLLAALCGYGGKIMTRAECALIGKAATKARNEVAQIKSFRQ